MKLNQLKVLLAVMKTNSFSEAALDLNVSQASVSNAISELEKSLGVKLFNRGRLGAKPTSLASEVAHEAMTMLQAEEAIKQLVSLQDGNLKGRLRLAAHPSLASKIVPKVFARLREAYPEVSLFLEVMTSNEALEEALHEGRVDIALLLYESSAELLTWQLLQDEFVALLPQTYPMKRETIGEKELNAFPTILQTGRQCGVVIRQYLEDLGVSVKPQAFLDEGSQVNMNEGQIILDLVKQGLGLAIVASMLIDQLPETVRKLPLEKALYRNIIVAIRPDTLKLPIIRVGLNALKDEFPESDLAHLSVKATQATA